MPPEPMTAQRRPHVYSVGGAVALRTHGGAGVADGQPENLLPKTGKGNAGIKWWLIEFGGERSAQSATT